jgi:hypothetical protein
MGGWVEQAHDAASATFCCGRITYTAICVSYGTITCNAGQQSMKRNYNIEEADI